MKTIDVYRPKKLLEGRTLGHEYEGRFYIAIPEFLAYQPFDIEYKGTLMHVKKYNKPDMVGSEWHEDVLGDPYKLYYFEWKPTIHPLYQL